MAKGTDVDARSQTFGVESSKEMIAKLRWEIDQAKQRKYLEESSFCGMNIAWTAYHVLDWIAAELTAAGRWKDAIASLGLTLKDNCSTDDGRRALQDFAINRSPYMQAAEQIANASKHRDRRAQNFDYGVVTSNSHPDVRIVVSGKGSLHGSSIPYFGEALLQWLTDFMDQIGLPTK